MLHVFEMHLYAKEMEKLVESLLPNSFSHAFYENKLNVLPLQFGDLLHAHEHNHRLLVVLLDDNKQFIIIFFGVIQINGFNYIQIHTHAKRMEREAQSNLFLSSFFALFPP